MSTSSARLPLPIALALVCACGDANTTATSDTASLTSTTGADSDGTTAAATADSPGTNDSSGASPTTGPSTITGTTHDTTDGNTVTGDSTTGFTTTDGTTSTTTTTTGDDDPFTVYLDPAGDDAHGGLSPDDAVLTLARAQEIVVAAAPDRDVEVRIAQGTYVGQSVTWTHYHPDHRSAFMPADYEDGEGIDDIAGRPVFDGEGAGALLTLDVAPGEETHLEFYYLEIQHYLHYGLYFRGNRLDPEGGWNGGNRIFGVYFTEIGSLHVPGEEGYGAIDLVNSRNNDIRNNHFVAIENHAQKAGLMHGVYIAHHSTGNQIRSNQFTEISGDPIRVRDDSNANLIQDNTFENTGSVAFYSDWYCDPDANPNCTKPGGECPSWQNEFRDNGLHCGYGGEQLPPFSYIQGGADYVPPSCPDHFVDGWKRLYTSDNTSACP
ncbi:Right handed beta helix region [Nannocystis exedens]|uniref:Right handed beta helix region n=1 Tax=Nannocystis exedens TaxID=54 RepID=A0A1I2I3R5_9BACT|nr:right-handed parallel beta-helix repeat-containing protein [Nannocystis exedens]SFF35727.1 Right handed beta helix region [Nannocystis exedens]